MCVCVCLSFRCVLVRGCFVCWYECYLSVRVFWVSVECFLCVIESVSVNCVLCVRVFCVI